MLSGQQSLELGSAAADRLAGLAGGALGLELREEAATLRLAAGVRLAAGLRSGLAASLDDRLAAGGLGGRLAASGLNDRLAAGSLDNRLAAGLNDRLTASGLGLAADGLWLAAGRGRLAASVLLAAAEQTGLGLDTGRQHNRGRDSESNVVQLHLDSLRMLGGRSSPALMPGGTTTVGSRSTHDVPSLGVIRQTGGSRRHQKAPRQIAWDTCGEFADQATPAIWAAESSKSGGGVKGPGGETPQIRSAPRAGEAIGLPQPIRLEPLTTDSTTTVSRYEDCEETRKTPSYSRRLIAA